VCVCDDDVVWAGSGGCPTWQYGCLTPAQPGLCEPQRVGLSSGG